MTLAIPGLSMVVRSLLYPPGIDASTLINVFSPNLKANAADQRGKSTTKLELSGILRVRFLASADPLRYSCL